MPWDEVYVEACRREHVMSEQATGCGQRRPSMASPSGPIRSAAVPTSSPGLSATTSSSGPWWSSASRPSLTVR